jgi:type I restriction enzyme S subunit
MPKPATTEICYISTKDFSDNNDINFSGAKRISREDFDALCRKVRPEHGDILLSRYGTVGVVRVVRTARQFQASYSIAIIKTLQTVKLTNYLAISLRSEIIQNQIKRDVRATAQPDLGLAHIKLFGVPLPPFAEQERIVAEVERRLSVVEELEAVVSANLRRATRLRQSVLQRAFAGWL